MVDSCFVCGHSAGVQFLSSQELFNVMCPRCGGYYIDRDVIDDKVLDKQRNCYILSGSIRYRQETGQERPVLKHENLAHYLSESQLPATFLQRLDLILLYLAKRSQRFGDYVELDRVTDYPVGYARDPDEFLVMVRALGELHRISTVDSWKCKLTVDGWTRAEELRGARPDKGNQCFVAMWFVDKMQQVYELGFYPAIDATGYKPLKINEVPHNNRIDDRILVEIRRSRLGSCRLHWKPTRRLLRSGVRPRVGRPCHLDVPQEVREKPSF